MKKILVLLLVLNTSYAGCLADFIGKHNSKLSKNELNRMELAIMKASKPQTRDYSYHISPYILTGLVLKESTARYWVINSENAQGSCQIIPKYNQASIAKMIMTHDTDNIRTIETSIFLCGEGLRERMHKAKGEIHKGLDHYHGHGYMKGQKYHYWRKMYNGKIMQFANNAKSYCERKA